MTRDYGYNVPVDLAPDRREEVEEERIAEAIEGKEAVRCELCGALIRRGEDGFVGKVCTPCARQLRQDAQVFLKALAKAFRSGQDVAEIEFNIKLKNRSYYAACVEQIADFIDEEFEACQRYLQENE